MAWSPASSEGWVTWSPGPSKEWWHGFLRPWILQGMDDVVPWVSRSLQGVGDVLTWPLLGMSGVGSWVPLRNGWHGLLGLWCVVWSPGPSGV